jgi:hypothetical protein
LGPWPGELTSAATPPAAATATPARARALRRSPRRTACRDEARPSRRRAREREGRDRALGREGAARCGGACERRRGARLPREHAPACDAATTSSGAGAEPGVAVSADGAGRSSRPGRTKDEANDRARPERASSTAADAQPTGSSPADVALLARARDPTDEADEVESQPSYSPACPASCASWSATPMRRRKRHNVAKFAVTVSRSRSSSPMTGAAEAAARGSVRTCLR